VTSGDSSQIPEQIHNTELENNHTPTPDTQPERASAGTATRLLEYGGPLLVVAVVLLVMATVYYFRWGFNNRIWGMHAHPSAVPVWLAFNDLGQVWSSPIGEQAQSVPLTGYDGQFYFYMAENPAVISACERGGSHCPIDANPEREQRILYPMTARLLTLGTADLLHPTLFFIDFAAILITVFLVARICLEAGASKWLSVAAGLFSGEVMGLLRDLAEPYAVMWTVLAVYLLRRNRPIGCAVAVAAALLTREQLVLVLPLLVVPLLAERRFRTACLFLLIALGPFLAWQLTLHALFGRWGLAGSFADTRGVRLPFAALLAHHTSSDFATTTVFAALPLIASLVIALIWVRHRGLLALLTDPVPLVVLIYGILATLSSYSQWGDIWASTRIVAPVAVLGLVVALSPGGLGPRLRTVYAVLLAATVLVMFVAPPVLY
jgi:hypothetical protein